MVMERMKCFIPISESQYEDLVKPWSDALICKIMGRSFSQEYLKKELQKVWLWKEPIDVVSLMSGGL